MTDNDDTPPTHLRGDDDYRSDPNERLILALERVLERELPSQRQILADQQLAINSLIASRDTGRKLLWLVIPALVGALATVLVFAADKISTSAERAGRQEAIVQALKEQRAQDREDIKELRERLLRMSGGIDPRKPTSDVPALPDLFTRGQGTSGTPASRTGLSGRVLLHTPKLQNGHGFRIPLLHSMLLLHGDPHDSRGRMSGGTLGAGEVPHAAMMTAPQMVLSIPYL